MNPSLVSKRGVRVLAGVLAAGWLALPAAAEAQPGFAGWTAAHESYRFSDPEGAGVRDLGLSTLRFEGGWSLPGPFDVRLNGAFASGTLTRPDGSTSSLSGFVDTEVRARATLGEDRLVLSALVLLPTGHSAYEGEELQVAGVIAADVLPFRISNWGSGGGAGMDASLAGEVGGWGLGAALGVLVGREFDPLAGESFGYRPGNQLSARVALDRGVGAAGRAALQVGVVRHGDDQLDGQNLYRSGDRLRATVSWAFPAGAGSSAIVYGGFLHRATGSFLIDPGPTASQAIVQAGAAARVPVGARVLVPTGEVRILRRDDGVGQGYTGSLGATLEWPVGGVLLGPSLRARLGRAVIYDEVRSSFHGLDLGLSARFGRGTP